MSNYVCARVDHVKTVDMINLGKENFRIEPPEYTAIDEPQVRICIGDKTRDVFKWYTDREKELLYRELKTILRKSEADQKKRFGKAHKGKNGKPRKWQMNQNTFFHITLSFTKEGLTDDVKTEDFIRLGKVWANKWAEKQKIKNVYICYHFDETTPHMHLCFENINADGCSAYKRTTKQTLRECQDLAGEVFGEIGFERGKARELTGKKHMGAREHNQRTLLEQERTIEQNTATLTEQGGDIEKNKKTITDQTEKVSELGGTLKDLQTKKEELQKEIAELRTTKEQQAKDIARDKQKERSRVARISSLRAKLKEVKQRIAEEQQKLKDFNAKRLLQEQTIKEIQAKTEIVKKVKNELLEELTTGFAPINQNIGEDLETLWLLLLLKHKRDGEKAKEELYAIIGSVEKDVQEENIGRALAKLEAELESEEVEYSRE